MIRTSIRSVVAPTAAALALGLALTGCSAGNETSSGGSSSGGSSGGSGGSSSGGSLSGTLSGAGSSAQEAAQGAWAAGFQSANSGATINYDPVGSGGGREQFLAGGVQFAGSDSYMTTDEVKMSKKSCSGSTAFEVPDYVSPIAIVYNLQGVTNLQLSAKTAAEIFSGTITMWNDPAIKAENSGASLPAQRIVPVHRSDDSGTSDNFTQWLSAAGGGAWKPAPDGVWPFKSGEGADGTSGVIQAVTNGNGTIGYADDSQAGQLSVAKIKVGSAYTAPSAAGAAKTVDVSKPVSGRSSNDLAVDVDRTTTESGAYPLILVSYLIGCPTYPSSSAKLVKGYLSYIVSTEGQQAAAKSAGSAPLSSATQQKAAAVVDKVAAQ